MEDKPRALMPAAIRWRIAAFVVVASPLLASLAVAHHYGKLAPPATTAPDGTALTRAQQRASGRWFSAWLFQIVFLLGYAFIEVRTLRPLVVAARALTAAPARAAAAAALACLYAAGVVLVPLCLVAAAVVHGRIVVLSDEPIADPPVWVTASLSAFGVAVQLLWITLAGDMLLHAWVGARAVLDSRRRARSPVEAAGKAGAVAVDVAPAPGAGGGAPPPPPPPPPSRCWRCPSRCTFTIQPMPAPLAATIVVSYLVASAVGLAGGLADPAVVAVNVPLARLPPALAGLRVGLLTDLHVGPAIGATRLGRAVDSLLATGPDIVALAGDIWEGDDRVYGPAMGPIRALAAACNASAAAERAAAQGGATPTRVCSGVYYVSGNHEPDEGSVADKEAALAAWGVTVLKNTRLPVGLTWVSAAAGVTRSADTLDLVGVPDWRTSAALGPGEGHNMAAAVAGRDTTRELVVVAHQPAHAIDAGEAGAGLMLAGHVHGGQMTPVHGPAAAGNLYFRGLYAHDKGPTDPSNPQRMWVYVSCGTFQWGPLFRQAAQAEVTVLTLTRTAP
jgi:predicted MPP superfamily phosphohydrolase